MPKEEIFLSAWNTGTLGLQKGQIQIRAVAGRSTEEIEKGWESEKGSLESFSVAGKGVLQWLHTALSIQ